MTKPIDIADEEFGQEVLNSDETVLVDFWAPWCGYCKKENPVLDELADEYGDKVKIVKIDVELNRAKAREYGVSGIPGLLVFNKGQLKEKVAGFHSKAQLENLLNKYAA